MLFYCFRKTIRFIRCIASALLFRVSPTYRWPCNFLILLLVNWAFLSKPKFIGCLFFFFFLHRLCGGDGGIEYVPLLIISYYAYPAKHPLARPHSTLDSQTSDTHLLWKYWLFNWVNFAFFVLLNAFERVICHNGRTFISASSQIGKNGALLCFSVCLCLVFHSHHSLSLTSSRFYLSCRAACW